MGQGVYEGRSVMAYKDKEKEAAYHIAYRQANKEKIAARRKAYYEANKERMAAANKAYYYANRERQLACNKAYVEANKEKVAAYKKAWHAANKEKVAAYKKAWQADNKEKLVAYHIAYRQANKQKKKAYAQANKGKVNAWVAKRKALKLKQIPVHLRECPHEKKRLVQIYKLRNILSEATGVQHHVDHMWPLADGGPHWSGNLQVIPAEENLSKNASVCEDTKATIIKSLYTFESERSI